MSAERSAAHTEPRPWCECDPEYEGRCPYPCQIDADEKREASSAAKLRRQPPVVGDRWRSRDRRDDGLIVRVLSVDDRFVYIKRFRKSRVRLDRWHSEYEFVGQF